MNNGAMEEIKARINIEDLASEYLDLRRAGRNFKALSPWTNERTPSFIVSPEKQIWHDFSSGKGGDIFGFIMEVEGLTFREALEFLARKAGIELQQFDNIRAKQIVQKKKRLYEVLRVSANFYQHFLVRDKTALDYVFRKRRLSKEIVQEFKIGYAPKGQRTLVDFLQKKGFALDEIRDAGMTNRFGGDIFRDRMVIALQDISGAPVGFTGRLLAESDNAPKYLNTPQTLLYDKSNNVFGLSQAKNEIRKAGFAVVVEGNMDVISSHQAGIKNVVATAGTAITARHLKTIARFSNDIRLCFDADAAGVNATERAIKLAQEVGVELSIIALNQTSNDAKDPDELIQIDPNLWRESISRPKPAVEWVFDQYEKRLDISTASGKRQFSNIALMLVKNLSDPVEKEFYLDEIARRIKTSREALLAKFSSDKQPAKLKHIKAEKTEVVKDDFVYEDDLLALILIEEKFAAKIVDLPKNPLHGENRNQIFEIIRNNDRDKLKKFDNYVKILLLKADERYGEIKESADKEIERLVDKVKMQKLLEQKEILDSKLEAAEVDGDENLKREIIAQIIELNKELNSGKR